LRRGANVRFAGLALVAIGLALLALPDVAFAQCAMCKATLEASDVGATFNRAILVMLAGPYLVAGVFSLVYFRARVRHVAGRILARLRLSARPGAER
jgi:hypothetical protein